jgi:cold shock CspA family protein
VRGVQATVATFDPDTGSGTVLTDDGRRVPFDPAAFAAGGLRLLRPGQRVKMEVADGRIVRVTIVTLR